MVEDEEKKPIEEKQPQPVPQQQNPLMILSQAFNQLSDQVAHMSIEVNKTNANYEIMSNRVDLLKSTIELLEKNIEFDKKVK